ncbi:MAG: AI-2E family transporter [Acidobacteriota bacterium]
MIDHTNSAAGVRPLLAVIAFVLSVAALQAAKSIVIPILLAAFLAGVGAPVVLWLERKRVPAAVSVLLVVGGLIATVGLVAIVVGASLTQFSAQLPFYRQRLEEATAALAGLFGRFGADVSVKELLVQVDPGMAMNLAAKLLTELKGALTNTFLIIFTMIFILLEASGFPRKLRAALGGSEAKLAPFRKFTDNLNRYVILKSAFSLLTGVTVTIWVAILGVDFPILWGLLAFLLNYIPSIGSILAAVPAVLLGFIQFGLGWSLVVGLGYVVINVIVGTMIEPRVMGQGLGLSTLVVFVSLVFWGWVLGPVGMLLSVPLTMTLKIALESSDATRPIAILLGPEASITASGKTTSA